MNQCQSLQSSQMFSNVNIKMVFLVLGPSILFAFEIITQPISASPQWARDDEYLSEECDPIKVERMIQCMKKNQVVNYTKFTCIDANRQERFIRDCTNITWSKFRLFKPCTFPMIQAWYFADPSLFPKFLSWYIYAQNGGLIWTNNGLNALKYRRKPNIRSQD